MKVNCSYCHSKIEFDEKEYAPGEEVTVECRRCGEEMTVTIPPRDGERAKENEEKNPVVVRRIVEEPSPELEQTIQEKSIVTEPEKVEEIHPKPKKTRKTTANKTKEVSSLDTSAEPSKLQTPKPESPKQDLPTSVTAKPKKPRAPRKPKETLVNITPERHASVKPKSNGNTVYVRVMYLYAFAIIGLPILVIVCTGLFRSCGSNNQAVVADSIYVKAETPEIAKVVEIEAEVVEDSVALDSIEAEVAEIVEAPSEDSEVKRIYLPSVAKYTSSEAYDVYPAYISDEKFGDSWASVDVVQDALRKGNVECFIKGEGDIEGYALSIDAVRLKDGHLYGRYHNDYNGVKLDINGCFDSNDDLVIKLGHKSEMSYWILEFVGTCEDGRLQYRGTWGRKDKPTSLKIKIIDN